MDATTRWETEAMRSTPERKAPPKPSGKKTDHQMDQRNWVTLREAEAATSIPANTLRKWVRKDTLPSYLEADGEFAIRLVDLDAVENRARELGRSISPLPQDDAEEIQLDVHEAGVEREEDPEPQEPDSPPGTMIVPIDAWNKMLNQLGNLHEAGQQLADARERAAKAETESTFLRERLAEMRSVASADTAAAAAVIPEPEPSMEEPAPMAEPTVEIEDDPDTTTYWRYLTSGWRHRKRNA